jgi:single-strand DNA-binding protein
MEDTNQVILIGRLTRDAELKYANNGTAIVNFSIANNQSRKEGDNWTDEPHFFDMSYFGKAAEAVHKYLTKGKQVAVTGKLKQNRWEAEGQKHSKVSVTVQHMQLLGGGARSEDEPGPAEGNSRAEDCPF